MPTLINAETSPNFVAPNISRKLITLSDLMMVIVDFDGGPQSSPELPHSHTHEQISYIAEGELYVIIGNQKSRLAKGDMFSVPSGVPHCIQMLTETVRIIDSFSPIRNEFLQQP